MKIISFLCFIFSVLLLLLFVSGFLSIDYKTKYWDKKIITTGTTSAGKPFSIIQRAEGIEFVGCSGHNPIIRICATPRKYFIDFIVDGKNQGALLRPDNIRMLYPVSEDRLLALQYPGNGINILEIKPNSTNPKLLNTIPYQYLSSAAAEKQDITISRNGNLVGWAEPLGLSVLDLRNGQQKKYLNGLPVRLPVFSGDEKKAAFYVWFDTVAAQNMSTYQGMTHMSTYTIVQQEYNKQTEKYIQIGTTTEYAGLFVLDLNTEKLIKINPKYPRYTLEELCGFDVSDSCKRHFDYFSYRDYFNIRDNPRSFYIDQWADVHFKSGNEAAQDDEEQGYDSIYNKNQRCKTEGGLYFDKYFMGWQKSIYPKLLSASSVRAYSKSLNICAVYALMTIDATPGVRRDILQEFIWDVTGNKELYHMSYGEDQAGNQVIISSASSFSTKQEFVDVKQRIFDVK
jgi:hypothetical protein